VYTNALIEEKSPYLRQHAHNPVQWLPWGQQAFDKARREDKPIFLSIGYSTCHWCHVMAHESFEDERTAQILNNNFVPVKVDREERPDVDRVYMLFVQASTGSGGWPMSVWLTPDLRPFFGGTYFPPDSRYGRPGFGDLLRHLAEAWRQDRSKIEDSSVNVTAQLQAMASQGKSSSDADRALFMAAFPQFQRSFDERWGGFGTAPKFPRPAGLNYLLRYFYTEKSDEALRMVTETLSSMAAGGMHDHLGGGFHRYSVDERWFVPHFEKMLYDQAQLATAYLEAFQITNEPRLAEVAHGILGYVLRDLRDPEGGFFSAEDADSADPDAPERHREGAFYVWRMDEIEAVLQEDAAAFCAHYGVERGGNVDQDPHVEFTGQNILYEPRTPEPEDYGSNLARSRQKLFKARERRPRPHLDRKVLTAWNALMISAFVKAGLVLTDQYLDSAREAAAFLLARMFDPHEGRLLRRFCDGEAAIPAFADDYSFFAQALLDLFSATGEVNYLSTAIRLVDEGLTHFEDWENGGFYSTPEDAPDVLLRIKDDYDGAEPSANSVAIDVLFRLWHLTGRDEYRNRGQQALRFFASRLKAQPTMAPQMLSSLGRSLNPPEQVVIRCERMEDEVKQLAAKYRRGFSPFSEVILLTDDSADSLAMVAPFLNSLDRKERFTIYHCHDFVCDLPEVLA
jgi:uncharacterized protein